ncbi:hypothetical protein [Ancylobacter polymorphus]|uniref:Uncharacterized protein n=1 Tax=Ancylobacter polymorphus TaxID=223390 RepID=A0ABU0BCQ8_9HYPH|nr:hypothetical protein [Ancylobacter polymorphus]MDQ0303101.1 hypothetical protein [Ancylobacter polymorphus]
MSDFARSVFINCPFDEEFEPILQAVLFCTIYLGFTPRIATESADSGAVRLEKIKTLIAESKYSIHDLSRIQARRRGEHFRLNMPFELGLDYGCRQFSGGEHRAKRILILEEKPYRYQAAISDLAGCDIQVHAGQFATAIRKVRNWLVSEADIRADGATRILAAYEDFQTWYYEQQLAAGFSERDIRDYPTAELLVAMKQWVASDGRP